MRVIAISITAALALLSPAAAQAHVTLQPEEAAAGSYTVLDVRVPNESENANTTKVEVLFPAGFAAASYQPLPGWSAKVLKRKLVEPAQTGGGAIAEGVHKIVWTGDGRQGKIAPGEFMDFPISVQIPGEEGDALTFKALQTYDDGEVVRWIGAPESDNPAPQVRVVAADDDSHSHAGGEEASDDDDEESDGLSVAALLLGALGLVVGGVALARSRRQA